MANIYASLKRYIDIDWGTVNNCISTHVTPRPQFVETSSAVFCRAGRLRSATHIHTHKHIWIRLSSFMAYKSTLAWLIFAHTQTRIHTHRQRNCQRFCLPQNAYAAARVKQCSRVLAALFLYWKWKCSLQVKYSKHCGAVKSSTSSLLSMS